MGAGGRAAAVGHASNFLRAIIAEDNRTGKYDGQVVTRFPPEPNGYLHYGHAKSIILNFGLAAENGGRCHLRYDDTNPVKEDVEFEDSIAESVRWLGFDWGPHRYHASDYYDRLYAFAEWFIGAGLAYVDSQSADEVRASRGTLTQAGRPSPFRDRPVAENMELFRRMRAGEFPDGAHVLRLKIDMASPNVNMRDPAIYRIRHASHHRTGSKWCIYPLYDYTHCISDALEHITHSICTLEFQDHRPLYDWVIGKLADGGQLTRPLPQQFEFARLNLTYVVLSKRRLIQLVANGHVDGWDDPRMPTLVGARRRGFTPEGFRLFAERIGVSKADSWIDMSILEDCMREDLNARAQRRIAILDPLKLVIDNFSAAQAEACLAPNHPQHPELGKRSLALTRELWIERDDYSEQPPKGYFRLSPGAEVRLRYGYIVRCTGADKDAAGRVTAVHCTYDPATRSGTPGADARKVKGNIHWLSAAEAMPAEVRLYDRLFAVPFPGSRHPWGVKEGAAEIAAPARAAVVAGDEGDDREEGDVVEAIERNYLDDLNPGSKRVITAFVEPALAAAAPEDRFQFERHGYFVADLGDHAPGRPVFNRAVTLKDSWSKPPSGP
ncbi:MAG: glutamine--tRNA ligase/YqeY domain fusion protein [Betaproteobacteria bacterium]|jgi:glutaminyl-tRNA synthetase|nr:glutamine--tRNA ligase/YqeY domain fusion protein [Betaproteobacteria bacterium]MBK7080057.1 glutamine--tRNA ligase/YqeY domain fusion protein [Betaproteobacteria bacterium]MBK8687958.1 glutamine--tRNA ligase/YqeY domain fusion protein [Betaproteobacteria bacterium]